MKDALFSTIRTVLGLLPLMLVLWGWTDWAEHSKNFLPKGMRQYAIALGLSTALISSLCFVGLILFPRNAQMGYWDNFLIASEWGRWNLPLSILSLILGMVGKGKGRWFLLVSGCCLVLIWTAAFAHRQMSK